MPVATISEAEFQNKRSSINLTKLIVLDFTFSTTITPAFEELSARSSDKAVFLKADEAWLSNTYSTPVKPTYIFYKMQNEVARLTSQDPGVLAALFDELTEEQPSAGSVSRGLKRSHSGTRRSSLNYEENDRESVSSIDMEVVEEELDVDIHELLRNEITNIDELLTLRKLTGEKMNKLYESVFAALKDEFVDSGTFPDELSSEAIKTEYVLVVLDVVRRFVCSEFSIDRSRVRRLKQAHFKIPLQGEVKDGRADYAIAEKRGERKYYYLAVVEVRSENCSLGIKQGLMHLTAAYKANDDRKPVYALCTTAMHYNLISYDPVHRYRLHQPIRLMFGSMFESAAGHDKWIKENTLVIDILFSILCEKLEIQIPN